MIDNRVLTRNPERQQLRAANRRDPRVKERLGPKRTARNRRERRRSWRFSR